MNRIASTASASGKPGPGFSRLLLASLAGAAALAAVWLATREPLRPPHAGLNYRLLVRQGCTGCVTYRLPGSERAYAGMPKPLIVAADIEGLRRVDVPPARPAIEIRFRPSSRDKLAALQDKVGWDLVGLVGERVVAVMSIEAPLRDRAVVTGFSREARDVQFAQLVAADERAPDPVP